MPAALEPIAPLLARVFTDRRRCPVCGHRGPTFTEPTCGVRRCLCCLEACCLHARAELERETEAGGKWLFPDGLTLDEIALCFLEDVTQSCF